MEKKERVRRILEYALEREHQGLAFFKENAGRLRHPAAQGVFEQLAHEEAAHARYVARLLMQYEDHGVISELPDAIGQSDLFSSPALTELMDQPIGNSVVSDLSVLRMAFLMASDLALFYSRAATRTEGGVAEALDELARCEKAHEKLFRKLHDTLSEGYLGMSWGGRR